MHNNKKVNNVNFSNLFLSYKYYNISYKIIIGDPR